MCRSGYAFWAHPTTSLQPDDLDKIRFLIVNHASTTDFRSKLICLSPYLLSNPQFSLCPPDPPGSIEQQRLGTPNVPGNATGTSYILLCQTLSFRTLDIRSVRCRNLMRIQPSLASSQIHLSANS